MKRFHVHVRVADLGQSVVFSSALFGAAPSRIEGDYAKWMLKDPRVNFAISTRAGAVGVDHLGFQADDANELAELKARATAADAVPSACCAGTAARAGRPEPARACC